MGGGSSVCLILSSGVGGSDVFWVEWTLHGGLIGGKKPCFGGSFTISSPRLANH